MLRLGTVSGLGDLTRLFRLFGWTFPSSFCALVLCARLAWGQPSSLELLSVSGTPSRAVAITVSGLVAFVADKDFGVWIYDLSDRDTLRLVGEYRTPGGAVDVAIDGTMLYVCDPQHGLLALYVGNLAQPSYVGGYSTTNADAVSAIHGRAYVASGASGLVVYDLSIPGQPTPRDSLTLPGYAIDIAVKDTLAYVLTNSILELVRVTPGKALSIVGSAHVGLDASAISLHGDHVYVAGSRDFQVWDVSLPANPKRVGTVEAEAPYGVFASEFAAYLADGSSGLLSINISDPKAPGLVNVEYTGINAYDMFYQDSVVYVANYYDVRSYVETPGVDLLRLVSAEKTPDQTVAVDTGGTVLYVSGRVSGIRTYDISTPEHPVYFGSAAVAGGAFDAKADDTILYVCAGTGSVQSYNVADPHVPVRMGMYSSPGFYASDLVLSHQRAYVVYGLGGFSILDLQFPWKPTLAGAVSVPGVPKGIDLKDTLAFLAASDAGLAVVNAADRAAPVVIGSVGTPDVALDLTVDGEVAYLACRSEGLQVVNISDPRRPRPIGRFQAGGMATGVDVLGDLCFLADDFGGLKVFDVSDPALPKLLQSIPTRSPAYNICQGNGVLYLATLEEVQTYALGPALISLNGGSESLLHVVGQDPTVNWTILDSTFAQIAYELEVGLDEDWAVAEFWDTDSVASTVHSAAYSGSPLVDGQTYHARLRLASSHGWDRWSSRRFSMNTAPDSPLMISPSEGAAVGSRHPELLVEATSEPDGDRQRFEFSVYTPDSTLVTTSPLLPQVPVSPGYKRRWTVDSALVDFENYLWSARTWDGFEWSSSTGFRSFRVQVQEQPPVAVGLWSPPYQGIVYSLRPTFVWTAAQDPNMFDTLRYTLQVDDSSIFTSPGVWGGLSDTVYSPADPLMVAHSYWWKVLVTDQTGLSALSWKNQLRIYAPGDVNLSWDVTTSDIVKLVNYLFKGEALGVPECAGSADGDTEVSVGDIVRVVNYVLRAGPVPVPGCH